MTAKEWLGVMQKAQDFPKGMERLIEKYGEMLLKEQTQVNKNCVLPDVSNSVCLSGQRYSDCHIHADSIIGCLDCGNFQKQTDC